MIDFSYCAPTRYVFGDNAECEAGKQLALTGSKKVLVVYGGGHAVKSGLLGRVCASSEREGIEWVSLGGIQPNPTDLKVREGIGICLREGCDAVLGVGGGSVIDTAKAIAAGAVYDGDFWDFWAGKSVIKNALPVGVVLTIPAAGSEGSGNSVITLTPEMRKISLRTDFWLRPKFALLNPRLTFTLPPYQTAAGVVDMMAHVLERYFTPTADVQVTDRISEGLLKAIMEEAPKVMADPCDYQARANIMWAGVQAHNGLCGCGRAEDWSSHAIEHELSAMYGVTHGAGLAVVFPAYLRYACEKSPKRVAQLAERVLDVAPLETERLTALAGVEKLTRFFRSIGMPSTLGELGIENPDLEGLTRKLHENKGEVFGQYFAITRKESSEIYKLMV